MATTQDSLPPEPHGALSPPSLLQIFWGRKAIILLGAVVGVTLGALYYAQRSPVYESTAQVLVEKKMPEVPMPGYDSFGYYRRLPGHANAHPQQSQNRRQGRSR